MINKCDSCYACKFIALIGVDGSEEKDHFNDCHCAILPTIYIQFTHDSLKLTKVLTLTYNTYHQETQLFL